MVVAPASVEASEATLELLTDTFGGETSVDLVADPGGVDTPVPFTSFTGPATPGLGDGFIAAGDLVSSSSYTFTFDLTPFKPNDFLFTVGDTFGDGLTGPGTADGSFLFTDSNGVTFATDNVGGDFEVPVNFGTEATYTFTGESRSVNESSSNLGILVLGTFILGGAGCSALKRRKNKLKLDQGENCQL